MKKTTKGFGYWKHVERREKQREVSRNIRLKLEADILNMEQNCKMWDNYIRSFKEPMATIEFQKEPDNRKWWQRFC